MDNIEILPLLLQDSLTLCIRDFGTYVRAASKVTTIELGKCGELFAAS